jgi:hypothetical protein
MEPSVHASMCAESLIFKACHPMVTLRHANSFGAIREHNSGCDFGMMSETAASLSFVALIFALQAAAAAALMD